MSDEPTLRDVHIALLRFAAMQIDTTNQITNALIQLTKGPRNIEVTVEAITEIQTKLTAQSKWIEARVNEAELQYGVTSDE